MVHTTKEHTEDAKRPIKKCDVLLIQRAVVDFYPPTINQANILVEAGLNIILMDGGLSMNRCLALDPRIKLLRPLAVEGAPQTKENRKSTWYRAMMNMKFVRSVHRVWNLHKPSWIITYESPAAICFWPQLPCRTVIHFHEYPELKRFNSLATYWNRIALSLSRKASFVIVPDKFRAKALETNERLKGERLRIVRNCPRRLDLLPPGCLKKQLAERGIKNAAVVLYQGSVSENYYADSIVASVSKWPRHCLLVFVGPSSKECMKKLNTIAAQQGVQERIIFFPQVPYPNILSYTVEADLAFSLIKPVTMNFDFMAGASNKRYEYMACGIPQIANSGPGVEELIEENGIGVCIKEYTPDAIAYAVTSLIADKERLLQMSKKARELHISRYHYEAEFRSVLAEMLQICERSPS